MWLADRDTHPPTHTYTRAPIFDLVVALSLSIAPSLSRSRPPSLSLLADCPWSLTVHLPRSCHSHAVVVPQAFVGLFKPLFPKSVQARLKFERAPYLSKMNELTPLTTDASARTAFLKEVDAIIA